MRCITNSLLLFCLFEIFICSKLYSVDLVLYFLLHFIWQLVDIIISKLLFSFLFAFLAFLCVYAYCNFIQFQRGNFCTLNFIWCFRCSAFFTYKLIGITNTLFPFSQPLANFSIGFTYFMCTDFHYILNWKQQNLIALFVKFLEFIERNFRFTSRSRPHTPVSGAKSTTSRKSSPVANNAYVSAPPSVHTMFASEFFNNVSRGYDVLFNVFQYLKVQVETIAELNVWVFPKPSLVFHSH